MKKEVEKTPERPDGFEWVRTDEKAFDSAAEILAEIDLTLDLARKEVARRKKGDGER